VLGELAQGVQVVDGHREEAVHLRRVQRHGEHPVGAGGLEQVRHEPAAERDARGVLLVRPGVRVVRHDDGDPRRRRPAGRVAHEEQLDEVLLRRRDERLHEEDVPFAAVRLQLHLEAVVGEPADPYAALRDPQVFAELGGQLRMRAAAEYDDVLHTSPRR
jgi:hypothetical protein